MAGRFEFNQDNTLEFEEYRSPGWDRYRKNKMLKWKNKKIKKLFIKEKIDGYIIPKNDEFFVSIYLNNDRLNYISNFSGSYGLL